MSSSERFTPQTTRVSGLIRLDTIIALEWYNQDPAHQDLTWTEHMRRAAGTVVMARNLASEHRLLYRKDTGQALRYPPQLEEPADVGGNLLSININHESAVLFTQLQKEVEAGEPELSSDLVLNHVLAFYVQVVEAHAVNVLVLRQTADGDSPSE